jgi:hypothetical protein
MPAFLIGQTDMTLCGFALLPCWGIDLPTRAIGSR